MAENLRGADRLKKNSVVWALYLWWWLATDISVARLSTTATCLLTTSSIEDSHKETDERGSGACPVGKVAGESRSRFSLRRWRLRTPVMDQSTEPSKHCCKLNCGRIGRLVRADVQVNKEKRRARFVHKIVAGEAKRWHFKAGLPGRWGLMTSYVMKPKKFYLQNSWWDWKYSSLLLGRFSNNN